MATTTLTVARQQLADHLGYGELVGKDGLAWTTTTNIAAATYVISTELRDSGFDDLDAAGSGDDSLENLWIYINGTNNSQTVRRIKAYDASSGTITVSGTDLSAESGSKDFEIHKYSPSLLRDVLNNARLTAFPLLHMPVSRSLFTASGQVRYTVPSALAGKPKSIYLEAGVESSFENSILSNGDFEDWTGSNADSWSSTNLDTAEETYTTTPTNYMVLRDGSSARCTSQGSSTGTLLQAISSPSTHSGQRVSFSVWVYSLTSGKIRTQIDINSTNHTGTTADGGEHQGTGWELLTHYEDSVTTLSTLRVGIRVDSDATDNTEFYVDEAICVVGPLQEPEYKGERLLNWEYIPVVQGTTLTNDVIFPYELNDLRRLRFEGEGYLSSLSAEADTVEIGKPQTNLWYAHAATELYRRYGQLTPDADGQLENRQLNMALSDVERLNVHAQPLRRRQLSIPDWGV